MFKMKKLFIFLFKYIKRIPEFAFKIGGTKKFQIGLVIKFKEGEKWHVKKLELRVLAIRNCH